MREGIADALEIEIFAVSKIGCSVFLILSLTVFPVKSSLISLEQVAQFAFLKLYLCGGGFPVVKLS